MLDQFFNIVNSEAFNVSVNPAVDNVSHSSNFFLSFFFPYLLNFLLYELIGPLDHLFKINTIIFLIKGMKLRLTDCKTHKNNKTPPS